MYVFPSLFRHIVGLHHDSPMEVILKQLFASGLKNVGEYLAVFI